MSESDVAGSANGRGKKSSCVGPFAMGCGTALVVALVAAAVMTFLSGKFWDFVSDQSRRAAVEEQFAENWNAPEETATIEDFSPETVLGYSLTSVDRQADFPALGIDLDGYHAIYEDGPSKLDVTVYHVDEQQKEAVFDEVERRINDDERFPNHALTRRPRVLDFRVSDPDLAGRLWYGQGWLILVRSHSDRDIADFSQAYLEAVGKGEGGRVKEEE